MSRWKCAGSGEIVEVKLFYLNQSSDEGPEIAHRTLDPLGQGDTDIAMPGLEPAIFQAQRSKQNIFPACCSPRIDFDTYQWSWLLTPDWPLAEPVLSPTPGSSSKI